MSAQLKPIDPVLATAISVTTAEVEYAKSQHQLAEKAHLVALSFKGKTDRWLETQRIYARARDQHLDALARLADLKVQAGAQ